jgi:hypothetical protein
MTSEAQVQQQIRVAAPIVNGRLWRNNSGALYDERGNLIRFGLGNDSAKLNEELKSSDLIGITPVLIEPRHVGRTVALFTAVEVKRTGWTKPANKREHAQQAFINLVFAAGGIATFATDPSHYFQAIERWKA